VKLNGQVKTILCAAIIAFAAGRAQAATITFQGHSNTIFGDENAGNGLIVGSSNGFDFTSSGDHFHFIDSTAFATLPNDGTGILSEDRDYSIRMTQTGGASFSLLGLDFAGDADNGSSATSLSITGFLTGGGTVTTNLGIVNSTSFFTAGGATFAGFGDVTSVVFDGIGAGGGFALDNITTGAPTAAAVPEPASLLLLGTGLAAAGARLRRRRKA